MQINLNKGSEEQEPSTLYERAEELLQIDPYVGWHLYAEGLMKELDAELQHPYLTDSMREIYTSQRNRLSWGIWEVEQYL